MVHMVPKQASSEKHELLDHHDDDHDDDVVHCENFIVRTSSLLQEMRLMACVVLALLARGTMPVQLLQRS